MNLGLALLLVLALILRTPLLFIMFGLLGAVAVLAEVWGRYALTRVEYRRTVERHRCFVGEELELRVELTNRKVLPVTYLTVEDTVPTELAIHSQTLAFARVGKGLLRLLFGLTWYQKVVRHYRITPTRRGYYQLGPATISGGDPFGYVQQHLTVAEPEVLIVYPKVMPLTELGFPSRRPFGDLKSKDRLFEDPIRFAGVREYQPGDPMSRVHWKATAASGQLQVRLLDPSANLGIAVFVNTWGFDLHWQGTDPASLEPSCVLAASVVNWAYEEGLPVGLYANGFTYGWGMSLKLPPARGPQVLPQALEGLARLHMPTGESLSDLLAAEAHGLQYGTSVVVITRSVSEELAQTLLRVQRSGRPVTLILVGAKADLTYSLPGVRIYDVAGEGALHAAVLA